MCADCHQNLKNNRAFGERLPSDGAWIIGQVFDAVTNSKKYNETVMMLSYDEGGLLRLPDLLHGTD